MTNQTKSDLAVAAGQLWILAMSVAILYWVYQ